MIVAQMFGTRVLLWDRVHFLDAALAPQVKSGGRLGHSAIVVGDDVEVTADAAGGNLCVVAVAPRRTYLGRPGERGNVQVVAANGEQVVIVSSVADPPFRPGLVDRWALLARRGGLTPILCVNKIDLATPEEAERAVADAAIPLPALFVSVHTGDGMPGLRDALRGRATVLVGHSGVGKSSLLQQIFPDDRITTAAVSAKSGKGRHTTSSSRLYALPEGGYVIDTPGVRSVSLGTATADEAAACFREIAEAPPCRFRECTHRMEPDCGVTAAVASGAIPDLVYQRYRRLLLEANVE